MSRFRSCTAAVAWAIVASLLAVAPARAAGAPGVNDASGSARTSNLKTLSAASQAILLDTATQAAQASGDSGGTSFFKTKKGAATLVLIAGGFGYALYSKSHDRVMSPIR